MIVNRAYKTELDPTLLLIVLMRKFGGTARLAYNWALKRVDERISQPNAMALHKEWNAWKYENLPWIREISKCPPHQAFIDLSNAFHRWFDYLRKVKLGIPCQEVGRPTLKKKSRWSCDFSVGGGTKDRGHVIVEEGRVKLPRLGWIRLKERGYIPAGRHTVAHVSQVAGRWFVSIPVQIEVPDPVQSDGPILGIDLGVKTLAICSDGIIYENPKALEKNLEKLAELERRKDGQVKGSGRWRRSAKKISKLNWRIANKRRDAAHKVSSAVVKTKPSAIVMEGMSVADLLAESTDQDKNRRNQDAGMGQLRQFVEYKSRWAGILFVKADRYYPSTQRCSACGNVKKGAEKMTLADRVYVCKIEECGHRQERDANAAENLRQYGEHGWTSETWGHEDLKLFTASSAGCARRSQSSDWNKREPVNTMAYSYV